MTIQPPPDPHTYKYICVTASTNEEEAAAKFAEKYGRPPQYIFEEYGNLWLGPVGPVAETPEASGGKYD